MRDEKGRENSGWQILLFISVHLNDLITIPSLIPQEIIISKIYSVRWHKIMLDRDLAMLYAVETKHLKRQVKRNIERFPNDFMFQLDHKEVEFLRWQIGTLENHDRRGKYSKYLPMAFTEHGILMLSSVLRSDKAIEVNINIIRVFNHMRRQLADTQFIFDKLEKIQKQLWNNEKQIDELRYTLEQYFREDETHKGRTTWFKVEDS